MKLEDILITESLSALKQKAEKYFLECSKKYFFDIKAIKPYPQIKVRTQTRNWGAYHPNDNIITINRNLDGNDKALKAVMYHETIHYWDFYYDEREFKTNKGHGEFFKKRMKLINSREGYEVVKIKYDSSGLGAVSTVKPYTLFWGYSKNRDRMILAYSKTPDNKPKFNSVILKFHRIAMENGYTDLRYAKSNNLQIQVEIKKPITPNADYVYATSVNRNNSFFDEVEEHVNSLKEKKI